MASTTPLLDAISSRCTIYDLTPESTIPDSRIIELVEFVLKTSPSAFNQQSCRCVVLLKDDHRKLWDIGHEVTKASVPPEMFKILEPKIADYRNGYGTVIFYEDPTSMRELQVQRKPIAHLFPRWAEHSSGMHQFALWTAFEAEGLGCNLQHYEAVEARAAADWNVPIDWQMKAQLVFGKPIKGRRYERTYKPLEERLFVHGA